MAEQVSLFRHFSDIITEIFSVLGYHNTIK